MAAVCLGFGRMNGNQWIRALVIFYATAVTALGLILMLSTATQVGVFNLGLAAVIMVLAAWFGPRWWSRSHARSERLAELEIQFAGSPIVLTGLWDTGNQLRDPVLGRPVLIAELSAVWDVLPDEILSWVSAVLEGRTTPPPEEWRGRLGVVSYHSLAGKGQIPVIPPDRVRVWRATQGWEELAPVVVGFSKRPISANGSYQALLSPDCQQRTAGEGVIGA
jgi:stage II sporulation protein GA (sporulation sigma-E factor processing peptidase)